MLKENIKLFNARISLLHVYVYTNVLAMTVFCSYGIMYEKC